MIINYSEAAPGRYFKVDPRNPYYVYIISSTSSVTGRGTNWVKAVVSEREQKNGTWGPEIIRESYANSPLFRDGAQHFVDGETFLRHPLDTRRPDAVEVCWVVDEANKESLYTVTAGCNPICVTPDQFKKRKQFDFINMR
jgi:hypothetical protein